MKRSLIVIAAVCALALMVAAGVLLGWSKTAKATIGDARTFNVSSIPGAGNPASGVAGTVHLMDLTGAIPVYGDALVTGQNAWIAGVGNPPVVVVLNTTKNCRGDGALGSLADFTTSPPSPIPPPNPVLMDGVPSPFPGGNPKDVVVTLAGAVYPGSVLDFQSATIITAPGLGTPGGIDYPNIQYLACANADGTAVTGWDGLLGANLKLQVPAPWSFYAAIDANSANGTAPCNPIDATADVAPGTHEVGICLLNPTAHIGAFDVKLVYNDSLNTCVPVECAGSDPKCLDANPDANVGLTLGSGVPTVPDLGEPVPPVTKPAWDCTAGGNTVPTCDIDQETGADHGVATLDCLSLAGPYTSSIGVGVNFPLGVVTFNTKAFGTDTMSLAGVAVYDEFTTEMGSCNPAISNEIVCVGAQDVKVTPLPATATYTPTPTNTPIPPTPTNTPVAGVRMEKDCNVSLEGVQDTCNLWIMAAGNVVPTQGKGCLAIDKWVFGIFDVDNPNDSDVLPEGLGAWEEQIRFDHKIIGVTAVPNNTWLESGGRVANCTMSVLTEDSILTGCVTKDGSAPGMQLGPTGPASPDGIVERITICPNTSDLLARPGDFRPTKDNGVVTDLEDDNCEVTDIYGEQIPGTLPGQLTTVCGDAHITIRMLEGDLNLDCAVTVLDDQAIAFRYGSGWGSGYVMVDTNGDTIVDTPQALYDAWYDLEPKLRGGDGDIDIKDLQFVFGRNWSTCQAPIPDDQAIPVQPAHP